MLIQITENDLQITKQPGRLTALEKAVRRCGIIGAQITVFYIRIEGKNYGFSDEITDWLYNYSAGKEVKPIKFEIDYILKIPENGEN